MIVVGRKKKDIEYRVLDMIAATIFVTEQDGGQYITRTQARHEARDCTSDRAFDIIAYEDSTPIPEDKMPGLLDQARAAIAWCASMRVREVKDDEGFTTENKYEREIRDLARAGVFNTKSAGRVSSIWTAYQRHLNRAPRPEYLDEFVGTVGEKIETTAHLIKKTTMPTTRFGTTLRVEFRDDAGHLLVWWCSAPAQFYGIEPGDLLTVKGKVKEHKVYGSTHQTILTRCKVALLTTAEAPQSPS